MTNTSHYRRATPRPQSRRVTRWPSLRRLSAVLPAREPVATDGLIADFVATTASLDPVLGAVDQ